MYCHIKTPSDKVMTFRTAGDTKLRLSTELLKQVEQSLNWISTLSLTRDILQFYLTTVCFAQFVCLHISLLS